MRLFFLSAEPSADLYGSLLIKALKEKRPDLEIFCVGGSEMESAGAIRIMDNKRLSVVGFWEGTKASLRLARIKERLKREISALNPNIFLPISFGSFSLPLCSDLKRKGIKIVYISPPQVWAWGKGRVKFLKRYTDKIICLFPFEQKFYQRYGIPALYFGNPLIKFVKPRLKRERIFDKYHLAKDTKIICLAPGSRREEIRRHLPFLLELFKEIREKEAITGFLLLPSNKIKDIGCRILDVQNLFFASEDKYDLIFHSELVIGRLGTISLETTLLGKTFIGIYLPHPLSYLLGRAIVKTPSFSLPNLILGKKVFPEFIRPDIKEVCSSVLTVLKNREGYEKYCLAIREILDMEDPAARIAEEILSG